MKVRVEVMETARPDYLAFTLERDAPANGLALSITGLGLFNRLTHIIERSMRLMSIESA